MPLKFPQCEKERKKEIALAMETAAAGACLLYARGMKCLHIEAL